MTHKFATTEAIKIVNELLVGLSPPGDEQKEYVPLRCEWHFVSARKVKDLLVSVHRGDTDRNVVQIFDARDEITDFNGGNLIGAKNVPHNTFLNNLGNLFNEYHDRKEILIHCMYSQQRGVKCANWYVRAIEELVDRHRNIRRSFIH